MKAAVLGLLVLWEQVERCEVHDDKVAATVFVEPADLIVHAVNVVSDSLAGDLAVGQEGTVPKIVGSNPDGVDSARFFSCEKLGAIGIGGLGIGNEGGELVAVNVGERRINGGE